MVVFVRFSFVEIMYCKLDFNLKGFSFSIENNIIDISNYVNF